MDLQVRFLKSVLFFSAVSASVLVVAGCRATVTPKPTIVLLNSPGPNGPTIDGWVNDKIILDPQRTFHATVGEHTLSLQANADAMTGTVNGQPVNCQNLILNLETGELRLDAQEVFNRYGVDYEFKIGN
jgi:hypothetical protein